MSADQNLGPTGEFPRGKINKTDEGELRIAIGSDLEKKVVIMDFGKPTAWLGFPPEVADNLADLLKQHAQRIRKGE